MSQWNGCFVGSFAGCCCCCIDPCLGFHSGVYIWSGWKVHPSNDVWRLWKKIAKSLFKCLIDAKSNRIARLYELRSENAVEYNPNVRCSLFHWLHSRSFISFIILRKEIRIRSLRNSANCSKRSGTKAANWKSFQSSTSPLFFRVSSIGN